MKKDLCYPDNHHGVMTYLKPEILKCLRKHHTNQARVGDGTPAELFQILKDDAITVMHSPCQQIWKTEVATGLEKVRFHSNPKERQCQNMFKLLQN